MVGADLSWLAFLLEQGAVILKTKDNHNDNYKDDDTDNYKDDDNDIKKKKSQSIRHCFQLVPGELSNLCLPVLSTDSTQASVGSS